MKQNRDACPSCGTHWIKHSGCILTCAKLQAALMALLRISEMSSQNGTRRAAALALASIKAMP